MYNICIIYIVYCKSVWFFVVVVAYVQMPSFVYGRSIVKDDDGSCSVCSLPGGLGGGGLVVVIENDNVSIAT